MSWTVLTVQYVFVLSTSIMCRSSLSSSSLSFTRTSALVSSGKWKGKRRHIKVSLNLSSIYCWFQLLYYKITDHFCEILSTPLFVHWEDDKDPVFRDGTLVPNLPNDLREVKAQRISLFREKNWSFRWIMCFTKVLPSRNEVTRNCAVLIKPAKNLAKCDENWEPYIVKVEQNKVPTVSATYLLPQILKPG
jgi:hypothetical protein